MSLLRRLLQRTVGKLRFPQLFLVTAVVFVLDLVVPDVIPMVDEILLGLATLLFGSWRDRKELKGSAEESGPTPD